jgi:hypothetical protein
VAMLFPSSSPLASRQIGLSRDLPDEGGSVTATRPESLNRFSSGRLRRFQACWSLIETKRMVEPSVPRFPAPVWSQIPGHKFPAAIPRRIFCKDE